MIFVKSLMIGDTHLNPMKSDQQVSHTMAYPLSKHWEHLHDKLRMFRQRKHLIDVVLILDSKEIHAHATILAAYSPTLFGILINPTSKKNIQNQIVLDLNSFNIGARNLAKIVDFMYDGDVACLLSGDVSMEDMQKDAYFLGVSQIVQYIDRMKCVDPSNVPDCCSPTCISYIDEGKEDFLMNGNNTTKPSLGGQENICQLQDNPEEVTERSRKRTNSEGDLVSDEEVCIKKKAKLPKIDNMNPSNGMTPDLELEQQFSHCVDTGAQEMEKVVRETSTEENNAISIDSLEKKVKVIVDSTPNDVSNGDTVEEIENLEVNSAVDTAVDTALDTVLGTALDTALDSALDTASDTAMSTGINSAIGTAHDIVQAALLATISDDDVVNTTSPSDNTDNFIANSDATDSADIEWLENNVNDFNVALNTASERPSADNENDDRTVQREDREQELAQWDEYCVDGEYCCPYCPQQKWKYLDKLCYHMTRVHGERAFQCSQCGQEFATKKTFTEHLNKHAGIKPYLCSEHGCRKSFHTSRLLKKHRKVHSSKASKERRMYSCPVAGCSQVCATRQQQGSHLLASHPASKTFPCQLDGCAVKCTTHTQLVKHVYTHTPIEDKLVVCEDCGKSVTRKNLSEHRVSHVHVAAAVQHLCQYCTYATRHKRYMDSHVKRRHGKERDGTEALKMHSCSRCSFASFFAAELRTHAKKHCAEEEEQEEEEDNTAAAAAEGGKLSLLLSCESCPYKTSNAGMMRAHKRTHTNERPYICQICTKGFRQSTHLSRHSRLHSGDRPFVCSLCGCGFMDKRALVNHQYNDHANVNQFLCHLCEFECVKQESLRTHMQKGHALTGFILDEKKNRRQITISGTDLIIHDKPQNVKDANTVNDSNRRDPLIGDLKQGKKMESDLNLIPTTIDEHETIGSLLENPVSIKQSDASLQQVIDAIDQSEDPLQEVMQEVIGDIDQSEDTLAVGIPGLDQSQASLQEAVNSVDHTDPDSEERILADDDVKLISKALQKGNVVLHFL